MPAHHGVDLKHFGSPKHGDDSPAEIRQGPRWEIPVLTTVAQTGEGIPELLCAVDDHRAFLEDSGGLIERRKARAADRVKDVVNRELRRIAWGHQGVREILDGGAAEIVAGRETPYSLAAKIVSKLMKH